MTDQADGQACAHTWEKPWGFPVGSETKLSWCPLCGALQEYGKVRFPWNRDGYQRKAASAAGLLEWARSRCTSEEGTHVLVHGMPAHQEPDGTWYACPKALLDRWLAQAGMEEGEQQ